MAKSLRDQHLGEYFPADLLKELDDAEKNVLYDEFSNSELRLLGTQELEMVRAQAAKHLEAEFARRLSHIKEDEYPMLRSWYLSISNSVHEIICSRCNALLGIEIDTKDDSINPNHIEGKFVVAVGDKMFSYRPRLDGVMGYQCANTIPVTDELKKAELSKYNSAKEERRKQLGKEITKRFADDFKEGKKTMVEKAVANDNLPKIKTKAEAEKMYSNLEAPGEPEIKIAVDINLDNEFPEPVFADRVYCGNDTRWSQIEIDNIPEEHIMTSLAESDIVKVKQEINATNYEPDVKETKKGYTVESFELREVKS